MRLAREGLTLALLVFALGCNRTSPKERLRADLAKTIIASSKEATQPSAVEGTSISHSRFIATWSAAGAIDTSDVVELLVESKESLQELYVLLELLYKRKYEFAVETYERFCNSAGIGSISAAAVTTAWASYYDESKNEAERNKFCVSFLNLYRESENRTRRLAGAFWGANPSLQQQMKRDSPKLFQHIKRKATTPPFTH